MFIRLKPRFLSYLLFLLLCLQGLGACVPAAGPLQNEGDFELKSLAESFVSSYILKAEERFQIKAVNPEHKNTVDSSVATFKQDLQSGSIDTYYNNPSFSILLAAGSEGSAFNSKEGIEQISKNGAVFAQAVVFNLGDTRGSVYKGQFSSGRFFFNRNANQEISPSNTTYLIALNQNLETQVFKGQLSAGLSAGSEGSALSAGSEGSALLKQELNQSLLHENQLTYQKTLELYQAKNEAYTQKVQTLKFIVDRLIPQAWTETYARLMRAYRDEMDLELRIIRGLPKGLLADAWQDAVNRVGQRWQADCGYSVPDSGKLFPQYGPDRSAIPAGYQSETLNRVIEEIPEFKARLAAELKLDPPARFKGSNFMAVLQSYQQSHPEIFAKHQWQDEFAPPACVKPRKRSGGVQLEPMPPPNAPGGDLSRK
ncbi:MAG: hypothetical protein IV090_13635 [Candidatus Sericytochromatia bacterium]|nr:hypothetical protein [Candidatus Sericytochromatia bacterium]